MITMSAFGVSPVVAAGNIGSRHAAHAVAAAVSAAAHKRIAAATDASVDRGCIVSRKRPRGRPRKGAVAA